MTHSINLDFILLSQICKPMKSSKSSPRARFQPDFFDFLCAENLKAELEGWKQQWFQRTPHCCLLLTTTCFDFPLSLTPAVSDVREKKRTEIEGSSSSLDCRGGRSKQFFSPVERRGRWAGLFQQGQGEEVCKGKAMARRRLQRRCETKGRRLKTTPCTWSGSFHDELGEIILEEGSTRLSICVATGLHVLPILSIVIYGVFLYLCLVPFLSRRQCPAASSDPLRCFRTVASWRHVWLPWQNKKSWSIVQIISSNQRNPRNPNLVKSMKSGLIERAHLLLVLVKVQKFECQTQVEPAF